MGIKESLANMFRGGKRVPDLQSERAVNSRTGRTMPHGVSRHRDLGEDQPLGGDGKAFKQGTLFPPHVSSGQIREIQETMRVEYHKWSKGQRSSVISVQDAGGADRVTVRLDKFGIRRVGGFVRSGKIATVFPEDDD